MKNVYRIVEKGGFLGYLVHGIYMWIYSMILVLFVGGPLNAFLHDGVWVWPTVDIAIFVGKGFLVVIVIGELANWSYKRFPPLRREEKRGNKADAKIEEVEENDPIIGDQWKRPKG